MSKENLAEILHQLQSDDQSILKSLFQEHYKPVCRSIHRFIKDKSTVEDIAQNVFIKFWEKRKKLNITSSVAAYLHRMGTNEAISYLRSLKHFESEDVIEYSVPNNIYNAEDDMLQNELQQNITNAINSLPPKCRAIFQLSRFEDLSYKEIAAKLGISVKTVENQMGKALRVLRGKLKGYLGMVLIGVVFLIGSCQKEKLNEIGVYESKDFSILELAWLGLGSKNTYVTKGATLEIKEDSTFKYQTCGNILIGNWRTEKDTLFLKGLSNRWRNDSLHLNGLEGKQPEFPIQEIKFFIKNNTLTNTSKGVNDKVLINKLEKKYPLKTRGY